MEPSTRRKVVPGDSPQNPMSPHHRHVYAPKWAVVAGSLAIGLLYMALPQEYRFGPSWLLLVLEVLIFIPLIYSWVTRRPLSVRTIRMLGLVLLGLVTMGLAIGVAFLVREITLPSFKRASTLLLSGGVLWCTNILVFALWHWEIDGGGPHKRFHSNHQASDLMFPQQVDGNKTGWAPDFIDYLFVAFTGATALSPADTYPLTHKAKILMMIEAMLSAIIIVVLIGRAVNILGS